MSITSPSRASTAWRGEVSVSTRSALPPSRRRWWAGIHRRPDARDGGALPDGTVEDGAGGGAGVIWLCPDAASFINGVALRVDGGNLA
jgi:hypothetical protein